jgi:hypothetical protein
MSLGLTWYRTWTGFDTGWVQVKFALYKVSLWQVFLPVPIFPLSASFHRCSILIFIYMTCLQPFYTKRPVPLLQAGSQATRGNITIGGVPNCLQFCVIFIGCTQFRNVAASDLVQAGGLRLDSYGLHAVLSRRKIVSSGAFRIQGCYGNRGNLGEKSVVFFLHGQQSCNARWGSLLLRKTCASSVARTASISALVSGGEVRTVIGRQCRLVWRSTVIVAVILLFAGWY